jgi:hypothetical protein
MALELAVRWKRLAHDQLTGGAFRGFQRLLPIQLVALVSLLLQVRVHGFVCELGFQRTRVRMAPW